MKKIFKMVLLASPLLLTACWNQTQVSKFDNESYMRATSVAPLHIPEDLASTTYIEPYYPAPAGEYPKPGDPVVSELPPGLGDLLDKEKS